MPHSWISLTARAVRSRFPRTRRLEKRASWDYRVGHVWSQAAPTWWQSPCCCGFGVKFECGGISWRFLCVLYFFERMHIACLKNEAVLPHLPLLRSITALMRPFLRSSNRGAYRLPLIYDSTVVSRPVVYCRVLLFLSVNIRGFSFFFDLIYFSLFLAIFISFNECYSRMHMSCQSYSVQLHGIAWSTLLAG